MMNVGTPEPRSCSRRFAPAGLFLAGLLCALSLSAQTYEEGRKAYIEGEHRRAFRILQPLAEAGNSEAQKMLGIMYDYGHGVKADSEKALHWYLQSAKQGHPAVQYQVGAKYFRGDGVRQDYREAARWWEMAANGGQVDAQFNLGLMYFRGLAIETDDIKAAALFAQAAEQGHGHSQYSLAVMYAFGRGVEKNYATARKWFEKSAAQDVGQAQYNLGVFYENGYGTAQDLDSARRWYEKAATQGVREAEEKLAEMDSPDYVAPAIAGNDEEESPFAAETESNQAADDGMIMVDESAAADAGGDGSIRRRDWVLARDPGKYTLQIGSVTREEDIVNFLHENNIADEAAYVKVKIKGVTRYNALYGTYDSYQQATAAVEDLPGRLRRVKPWVRSYRMIHKLLDGDENN